MIVFILSVVIIIERIGAGNYGYGRTNNTGLKDENYISSQSIPLPEGAIS